MATEAMHETARRGTERSRDNVARFRLTGILLNKSLDRTISPASHIETLGMWSELGGSLIRQAQLIRSNIVNLEKSGDPDDAALAMKLKTVLEEIRQVLLEQINMI